MGKPGFAKTMDPALRDLSLSERKGVRRGNRPTRILARFLDDREQRKAVTTRKVLLRADHPQLVEAILPHEVTHVVVADLFTAQQIPRWADEGIAVLAEPESEQNLRAADLRESLSSRPGFRLAQLMSIERPKPRIGASTTPRAFRLRASWSSRGRPSS